jgi:hypothetical protein
MELLQKTEITINNITFDIKTNVKDIFTDIHTGNKSYTFYEELIDKNNLKFFFLFEAPFHEAFCHWVFESAIFLPFVKNFTSYDNFFVLVNKNNERKYKKSFFKLFNIDDKNIQYIDNLETHTDTVSYKNIPNNNISIVCRNFILNQVSSSLNDNLIENYTFLINHFRKIILSDIHCEKQIENLFLPRSKIENYIPNDRRINYDGLYALLNNKECVIYDTQETDNFIKQVIIVQKSKNIYTYWGSSFYVNGFFSKECNIYIAMNGFNYNCDNHFTICKIIKNVIENNNNIFLV